MIILWVIKVIRRALWGPFDLIKLCKDMLKEAVKVWIVLDGFKVFSFPLDNLFQSLDRFDWLGRLSRFIRNLDLEREMSILNETSKVTTILCNIMDFFNEFLLNIVI